MNKDSAKIVKSGILLAVVVIYLAITGVNNARNSDNLNSTILKEVTVVNGGEVKPENDGKLVLVTGRLSFDESVKFDEVDFNFNSFKVERTVKDYVKIDKDSSEWVEREEPKAGAGLTLENADDYYFSGDYEESGDIFKAFIPADSLYSVVKTVPVKLGNFTIDSEGLDDIPVTATLTSKDITICGLVFEGTYYTNPGRDANPKTGDVSVSYSYYDMSEDSLSILAKQSGSTFEPYQIGKEKVYKVFSSDVNSADTLKEKLGKNARGNIAWRLFLIIFVLVIGIVIIKGGKEKKNGSDKTAETAEGNNEESETDETAEKAEKAEKTEDSAEAEGN